jgi:Calx-beta domain-containing protein
VPLLTFDHYVATERGWDGGNLQVSVDGGAWTLVPPTAFTYNSYNTLLNSVAAGNTDPLAGQPAFSGSDCGTNTGSWGRSHVDLTGLAAPGQTVRLRYNVGTDGCGGVIGWFVDDVTLYACTPDTTPVVSINDASVTEGTSPSGYTDMVFTVSLDHASNRPVSVSYRTQSTGSAGENDYREADGELQFPPLTLTRQVTIRVRQDSRREATETFKVVLSHASNASIGKGEGIGTIIDDDSPLVAPR